MQQHHLQRVGGAEDLLLCGGGELDDEGQRLGGDEALQRGEVRQRAWSGLGSVVRVNARVRAEVRVNARVRARPRVGGVSEPW